MLSKHPTTQQDCLTEDGRDRISNFVTDPCGPIYAFKETLPAAISAAAMARLSRSSDDLRVLLLKEFSPLPEVQPSPAAGREIGLLRRVITEYGDDSVQQLCSLSVVVESASNLLTKLLERPRIGAAYLEQSTRYIFFDQQTQAFGDDSPHYRYVVPAELNEEEAADYRQRMDTLFKRYSHVVRTLVEYLTEKSTEPKESRDLAWRNAIRAQACDAARGMLPAATTSTVGIHASAQALDSLIMHLLGHPLKEAQNAGAALLSQVRQVAPVFFERTDRLDRGAATTAYLRETKDSVAQLLNSKPELYTKGVWIKDVSLVEYAPQQEEWIAQSLAYPFGMTLLPETQLTNEILSRRPINLPRKELTKDQAKELIQAYAGERQNRRHRPGRMFEEPHYTFEFFTSYGEFRDLQRHRTVDAFEWQELSPIQMDFDVPDLVKEASLEKYFKESFEQSQLLWASLMNSHGSTVAQYAVLFGFKMAWRWTINLREATHIIELRTTPQGHPAYRRICQKMFEQIRAVHPILASTIKFVNCGEDPELTRLAAERAAAFKLAQQK
jgi:thymidylate synthase ThyX